MIELAEADLYEVVEVVCMTVFDMPVESASVSDFNCVESLTCSIAISGAWTGTVQVKASVEFLTRAAAVMFHMDMAEVKHMDRVDTFTELNNMMGGTVKCLLPEPCDLALPQLISAEESDAVSPVWGYYLCDDKPLAVAVTKAIAGAEKAA